MRSRAPLVRAASMHLLAAFWSNPIHIGSGAAVSTVMALTV
jgi:hypothetical protein